MTTTITVGTTTALGYFRVSSLGQAGERHVSLEVQQAAFQDYCKSHSLSPVATFTDVASGRKDDRQQYREMLQYVAKEGVGKVVVLFLDRFGRNPREILRRYWDLQERGTEVQPINEDLQEELMLLLRAGIAGAESKRTGERVRAALKQAASRGRYVAKLPFGYVKVQDVTKGEDGAVRVIPRVQQVPSEVSVIRLAYDLSVVQNKGYKAIADELNRRGYRTRTKSMWATQSVKLLLMNPAMTGKMVWMGETTKENAYPPILTTEEWDRLQQRLKIRREGLGRGRIHSSVYFLSGVLRCGECGAAMTGDFKGRGKRYYTCANRKMSEQRCTEGKNHRQDALEKAILDHLGQYSGPDTVRKLLESQGQELDTRNDSELARASARLTELETGFLNDLDRVDRGIMTEAEYLKRQEARRQEQDGLQARKTALEASAADQRDMEAQAAAVPVKVRSFLEDFRGMEVRQAKAVLQGVIKAAHVYNDGRIELEFRR